MVSSIARAGKKHATLGRATGSASATLLQRARPHVRDHILVIAAVAAAAAVAVGFLGGGARPDDPVPRFWAAAVAKWDAQLAADPPKASISDFFRLAWARRENGEPDAEVVPLFEKVAEWDLATLRSADPSYLRPCGRGRTLIASWVIGARQALGRPHSQIAEVDRGACDRTIGADEAPHRLAAAAGSVGGKTGEGAATMTSVWHLQMMVEQLQHVLEARATTLGAPEAAFLHSAAETLAKAHGVVEPQARQFRKDNPGGTEQLTFAIEQLLPAVPGLEALIGRQLHHHPEDYPAFTDLSLGPLNPGLDWGAIEDDYFGSSPHIIYIDDFLTPAALALQRRWLLEASIWHEVKHGYLGAYWTAGSTCPLTLQIASELRRRMPRVFGRHELKMNWAYKYDQREGDAGIAIHADAAAVNVNLWLTDDVRLRWKLGPDGRPPRYTVPGGAEHEMTGGLRIYHYEPPEDWSFDEFNAMSTDRLAAVHALLAGRATTTIPHKANRIAIFQSDLLHSSDGLPYEPGGYEDMRINLTFLFGTRQLSANMREGL
jgi:hypothetical protein